MRITILSLFLMMMTLFGQAQEFNVLDSQGRKQGLFKKYFENTEQVYYTGQFKNDIPFGTFIYYYKEGPKKAEMQYQADPLQVHALTYYIKGALMAEGVYYDKLKDGLWKYYDEKENLSSSENWLKGKKHGEEKVYFPDGKLGEELTWKNDLRDGAWKQYFEDGVLYLEGFFLLDQYGGQMTFYYRNGKKEISGKYINGLREGTWFYFNEDGSIHMQMLYRKGAVKKEKRENGLFYEYGPDKIILAEIYYKNGLKEGPFVYYHEDASFSLTEVADPLTGEKFMKEVKSGNLIKMKGNYKNDLLDGLVEYFNEAGVPTKKERYEEGQLK
jgi:antitoxin component YwqK of YwqJK toxin-antitoxin module